MGENKARLYTVSEACSLLHIHPNTLRRWDKEGKIKVVRHGRGHRRVPEEEIARVLQKSHVSGEESAISSSGNSKEDLKSSFLSFVFSYNRDDWELVKRAVLIRDNYTCVKCGGKELLDVHHRDGTSRNDPDNLITLCKKCHEEIHGETPAQKKHKTETKTKIKHLDKTKLEIKTKTSPEEKEMPRTSIIDGLAPSGLMERTAFGGLLSGAIALKNFTVEELAGRARCPIPVAKRFCERMEARGHVSSRNGRYEMVVKVV